MKYPWTEFGEDSHTVAATIFLEPVSSKIKLVITPLLAVNKVIIINL